VAGARQFHVSITGTDKGVCRPHYFQDTSWVNLENGEYGLNQATYGSTNHLGKNNEGSVAGILWDTYDYGDTLEDFSTIRDGFVPDGIGDSLSLPFDTVINALLDTTSAGNQPDHIDDFWETWFLPLSQNHVQAMLDIWYEHGDDSLICIGIRGDVNSDGKYYPDILDQTYLVDRIFRGGPISPRPLEADVNGSGGVPNILDLTLIIDYLFRGGPPPPSCP
jgi:hypothetical protein